MKRKLFALVAILCATTMWADTDKLVGGDGWTKLTTGLPQTLGDYYFAFVDNESDLMLSFEEGNNQSTEDAYKTMVYRNGEKAHMNPSMLWTLEAYDGGYLIKNCEYQSHFLQTEWNAAWYCRTHDNGGGDKSWGKWNVTLSDGKYTLENGKYTGNFIGPWGDANFVNGAEVAGNKTGGNIGYFQIYAILRTAVDWENQASESNPANYTYKIVNHSFERNSLNGWTNLSGNGTTEIVQATPGDFSNKVGARAPEQWWGAGAVDFKQTVTGLPDGQYELRALAIHAKGSGAYIYAGNDKVEITRTDKPAEQYSVRTTVKGGSLTIGVKGEKVAQSWLTVDEFELFLLKKADLDKEWSEATQENPYLTNLIQNADCAANDAWNGSGRTTKSGQHWSGDATRDYFTQNHESGAARSQNITLPKKGIYLLRTAVRPVTAGAYATITFGDITKTTQGACGTMGGNVNLDGSKGTDNLANNGNGFGWVWNEIYMVTNSDNESKTISIALSNENAGREADCGGMYLYYLGEKAVIEEDGQISVYGTYDAVPTISVNANTTSVDLTGANYSGSLTINSNVNPNMLIYTTDNAEVSNSQNVIKNGTCANLVLTDGHPFKAHKNFEATSARYTMSAIASNETKSFGTLMLPYAVSSLPGKAYTLDQGISMGNEIHATEVSSINANTPVLVTAAGPYSANNVPIAATNDSYANGELVGTYKVMTAEAGIYVLQKHDQRVAFFMVGDAQPTLNPFRAYIKAQASGAKALTVIFDDEETAISKIEIADEQTTFDLSGRKVSKASKGLYIKGGKKIVIK